MSNEFEAAAAEEQHRGPSDEDLRKVSTLAERLKEQQQKVDTLEKQLKEARSELRQTQQVDLPEAMQEAGLSEAGLSSGENISVKEGVDAHISKANQETAFQWLEDNGHGDLIKRTVSIDVGRDDETYQKAKEALQAVGIDPEVQQNVHPQTLKAFVRRLEEEGQPLPPEKEFGIYHFKKAEVK